LVLSGAGATLLAACGLAARPASAPENPADAPAPSAVPEPPTAAPALGAADTSSTPVSPAAATAVAAAKPAAQPKAGGTIRWGMPAELSGLEAHIYGNYYWATLFNSYDRLMSYDLDARMQPKLAESWDVSSDVTQIKLNLRKGVQFHNGRELTSDDVKWNFLRGRDPKVAAGRFFIQSNWFSSVENPDKYTVILKSDVPRPGVWDFFEVFNILDKDTTEGPDAKTKAIGTGPFSFVEWIPNDHWTFTRNQNYWQSGKPYLDRVEINVYRDPLAMATAFEAGALDAMDTPSLEDFGRLKTDSKYVPMLHPGGHDFYFTGANTTMPVVADKRVRQALAMSVDRQRFIDAFLPGTGSRSQSLFWDPMSLAYEPNKEVQFDLDKARALLAASGASNLEVEVITRPVYPEMGSFHQMYQADLAKIGVKLNILTLDQTSAQTQARPPTYKGLYSNTNSNFSEPVTMFFSSGFNQDSNNSGFKNDRYSQLVTQVSAEPDAAKRKTIYSQINDIFVDESFAWAIATIPVRLLVRNTVHDVKPVFTDNWYLTDAWID
jgi:peptide/nickel transport system substrate-binding protein